jgi:hypothetical protein
MVQKITPNTKRKKQTIGPIIFAENFDLIIFVNKLIPHVNIRL